MKISPLTVLAFALPTAILSALSVTELSADLLSFLEIPRAPSGKAIFLPTVILPALIFGLGMFFFLKRAKIYINIFKFVSQSVLIYFFAYFFGFYFADLTLLAIAATPIVIIIGTPLFLHRIANYLGIQNDGENKITRKILTLSLILAISMGAAVISVSPSIESFLEDATYGTEIDISAYHSGNSSDWSSDFGSVLPGTQILVFVWQIIIFFWVAHILERYRRQT